MKDKTKEALRKFRKAVVEYIITNRLFLSYVILSLIGTILIRHFTVDKLWSIKPLIVDLAWILMIGSLGYFVKPKNQFKYFFIWLIIFTIMEIVNSVYYTFYTNFASFSEIATLGQVETVVGSIFERLRIVDFIYIIFPLIFYAIHEKLSKTTYYNFIEKIEKGKKMFIATILVGVLIIGYSLGTATKTDYSRLSKQWNRIYNVERFGVILYQFNDLVQSLTPKLSSLFGYEDALELFNNFYTEEEKNNYTEKNKYTGILDGYNIIFVHMEGMQTYLMDLEFNGVEATPTINKLAKEGLFFKNFYPQISTGTSSDTEFTILTSLMPAASGTVFVSYYDRDYITIPKLLTDKGYYTFSMHGNLASMWNRSNVHPLFGYQGMYFAESFTYAPEEKLNLGISDKMFFEQAMPILENVEATYEKYMGTIITLSNHSPFIFLDQYGEYDMSTTYEEIDPVTGNIETITTNYLYDTPVGNYIMSSHYADEALGEFINYVNNSNYFNNTVFVMYGDHDAKLSHKNMNYLYNYDYKTGEVLEETDENYTLYDNFDHELNKNTPLIIWTKNKQLRNKLNGTVSDVMGMYDVMPTIGNMLGIENEYALGNDIFNVKDENVVIFPNGNFLTNMIYYNNSTGESKILKEGVVLDKDYIENYRLYAEKRLEVSNSIVVHDLLNFNKKKAAEE